MFGPANGVSNNLALEKIYCMLILRIREFWPPELSGHKTIISQRGGGAWATRDRPLATPLSRENHIIMYISIVLGFVPNFLYF